MGLWPDAVHDCVRRLPFGKRLDGWLTSGENWILAASGTSADPEVVAQLEAFYHESRQLTRGGAPERFAVQPALQDWKERVLDYLREYVPNEAFGFDTCDHSTADPLGRLHKQQEKLRAIIHRLSRGP